MKHISCNNVHTFCRGCLSELESCAAASAEKYNIHQKQELRKWFQTCLRLAADSNDGLPQFLCQQCYDNLRQFYEFRSMCSRSTRFLIDLLSKPAPKEEVCTEGIRFHEFEDKVERLEKEVISEINANRDWLEFDIGAEPKQQSQSTNIHEEVLIAGHSSEAHLFLEEADEYNKGSTTETNLLTELAADVFDKSICEGNFDFVSAKSAAILEVNDNLQESECCVLDEGFDRDSNECWSYSDSSLPNRSLKKKSKFATKPQRISATKKIEHKKIVNAAPKKFEIKFQCEHCPRRCISQENLDAHMRIHQGLKPFQCTQCERSFNKSNHLRDHVRETHSDQKEIVCSYEGCNKVFRRHASYRMHYRKKHADVKPENKTYVCEDCGRTYKNITMLREHRYKHAPKEEYPYQCEHCCKRYVSKRTYKDHLLRHAGIKNYECPHCGMKKITQNELRTHINYHTKEKQWPCPLCPSVFNSSANLGMHDRIVHKGIRRFACRFCDQSFGKPDTLKHHEMRHTGEKPHICSVCNKGFIQSVALRAHLKTHNKSNKKRDTPQSLAVNEDS